MDKYPKYISQEQQEEFETFLLGNMNLSQKEVFKQKLQTDTVLNAQFNEFKDLFVAVEEENLRSKLDDFHTTIEEETPVKHLNTSKKRFNYSIAASVAILLTLGGLWFLNRQSPNEKLFHKYYTQDPGLPTVMGSNDNFAFYEAMVDYKRGDYETAIRKWEQQLEGKPENDTLNYFLGSAYLANNDAERAIPFLDIALKDKNSSFKDDNLFYLGLAYLKSKNAEKAIEHLSKSKLEKAKKVLEEIKK